MIEHFKGEEVFVKKVLEFKDQALYKQRLVLTKFLNPYHQSIVYSIVGNQNDLIDDMSPGKKALVLLK